MHMDMSHYAFRDLRYAAGLEPYTWVVELPQLMTNML
jgi:hypothetical protein